jgi:hypothetical protein
MPHGGGRSGSGSGGRAGGGGGGGGGGSTSRGRSPGRSASGAGSRRRSGSPRGGGGGGGGGGRRSRSRSRSHSPGRRGHHGWGRRGWYAPANPRYIFPVTTGYPYYAYGEGFPSTNSCALGAEIDASGRSCGVAVGPLQACEGVWDCNGLTPQGWTGRQCVNDPSYGRTPVCGVAMATNATYM